MGQYKWLSDASHADNNRIDLGGPGGGTIHGTPFMEPPPAILRRMSDLWNTSVINYRGLGHELGLNC